MRWWPKSLRTRLTLWYAGALTAVLVVYAGGVFAYVSHSFHSKLDRQVDQDFEAAEELLLIPNDVLTLAEWQTSSHHEDEGSSARWVSVWNQEGELLHHRVPSGKVALPAPGTPPATRMGPESVVLADGEAVRQVFGPYRVGDVPVTIAVARSEQRLRRELNQLLLVLLVGLPLAVVLAGLGGWFLAGRVLRPVGKMAARARTITAECLSARLPVESDDELGSLATVFNETLARLERSFGEMARFTADASHELRTPLTAMRSVGEVGLKSSGNEASYRAVIGSMLEEVDRMARLVEGLLTLARADGTDVRLQRKRTDLVDLAGEVARYLQALAEEKGQSISVASQGELQLEVDPAVLRQAVVNLVDNAIEDGTPHTPIHIRVERSAARGAAILEVVDSGPGIAPEHAEQVFQRFYRVHESRTRELGGTGLGLAIARWAVEIHGGHIELESAPGKGSLFRIVLPDSSPTRQTP